MLQQEESLTLIDECSSLIQSGDLKSLKKCLFDLKRDESWIGDGGLSPLHLAATYNQLEICQFLLKEGMTPDITEPFTMKTPLHLAAYFGHLEIVKTLRDFGAFLDAKDCIGCSPIHYAAMGQKKDLILFFIENQIKLSTQSIFGNVLDILIRKKDFGLVEFFSNIGGLEPLDNKYMPYDCPRRSINDRDWTPFHSAAVSGQVKILEMLIRKFPCVLAIKKNVLGCCGLRRETSVADLAVLEGTSSIKKKLQLDHEDTQEHRKLFMKRNSYETDFSYRKELCDAIRYRDIKKLKEVIKIKGVESLFEREEKKGFFTSDLENPNACDFATFVYSLPFFDFLIEKQIEIPIDEFLIVEREDEVFFNWALMEVHPLGEGCLKSIQEGVYNENFA